MNYAEIEQKWQKAWDDARIFESEVNEKKPYMVFAAFPYTNTALHIGHVRTYGTTDVLARYKRMQGYNVLYPMGFHGTGTPVVSFATRIKNNDKELVEELKIFHIPDADIARMTDPTYIVNYFVKTIERDLRKAGLSIDWRRKFTTIEPLFMKMVEWQFKVLNEKGYLVQGKHPVGWCPNDNNAVGMHDTVHDVEPDIEKEVAIRFKVDGENAALLCTTYRPETIFGVTNIFVAENSKYVLCRFAGMDGEYYISKESAAVLGYQMKVEVVRELDAAELLKKKAANPINGELVPVLPGFFVKESVGTGVVMSVPAHAPFDYAALERLRAHGYDIKGITAKKIIEVKIGRSLSDVDVGEARPIHVDIPALGYLEVLHTNAQAIDDMLEFATKLEYREESHWGKMLVKGYEGMSQPEAREKVKALLLSQKSAFELYILANAPLLCRCHTPIVVKVVDDQWFINYADPKWKELAKQTYGKMNILPEKARNAFDAAIDWIGLRAVARARGLGTPFPLDKRYIIESLSDSTIYPAFYTVINIIRDVDPAKLTPEFFDYVYLGKGSADAVAKSTGIEFEKVKNSRDAFSYWYTQTSNHSAAELIFNHFTMYIFNHAAIFDKTYWPKQIVANGMVNYEGEKMSKSLGNIIPVEDGVAKYGADPLRFLETAGSELFSDAEFGDEPAQGVRDRFEYLYNTASTMDELGSGEITHIDYWLYSKLNRKIADATAAMESMELRDVATNILYNSILELKRYFMRGGGNGMVIRDFLSAVSLMLNPFAPHVSEEFWHMMGNDSFASVERWPTVDKAMVNAGVEAEEDLIDSVIEDSRQVMQLMSKKGGKAKSITMIVASDWKRDLANMVAADKSTSKAMAAMKTMDVDKEAAAKYVASLAKKMNELRQVTSVQDDEFKALDGAKEYISKALGLPVAVEREQSSKSQRAPRAAPMKPSIDIVA